MGGTLLELGRREGFQRKETKCKKLAHPPNRDCLTEKTSSSRKTPRRKVTRGRSWNLSQRGGLAHGGNKSRGTADPFRQINRLKMRSREKGGSEGRKNETSIKPVIVQELSRKLHHRPEWKSRGRRLNFSAGEGESGYVRE